jgi:ribulose 1,5-bisphosphate carboxylase large subunit-like protein
MKTTAPNCLVSQLYIETEGSLRGVAEETVRHETIGKWDRPGKPTELFRKSGGYLLDYEEHSPGKGKVALAYPLHNLDLKNSAFSHIWVSMITGMSAMPNLKRYRVLDFTLPDEAYSFFPGPRFGLEGTRQILQIDQSEPIIGTIIKPTCGLTPDEVADICEAGAMAGLKFIKDDERMMNPAYCPLQEKVRKVTERLRKVYEQTGNKVLYTPCITIGPDKILAHARMAVEAGANGVMFVFIGSGFESLRLVAESDVNVPIYAHCCGKEHWARVPDQGIDQQVVTKFARLMGGDYFRIGALGGYFAKDDVGEAASFVRPHRKLIASGINIFKAPSSRKGEDILHNTAAGLDDSRLSRLKVRREQHHQRRRRAMRRIGVDAGGDSAALGVHIVVAPILERPAKHFTIELLARSQSCSRGGWELDVIDSVFFWVVGHRWGCGHAERRASATGGSRR